MKNLSSDLLSASSQFSLEPSSASVNKQVGLDYLGRGDKVRAKEYLVRRFQLDPAQPDVAGQLGRLGVGVRIPERALPLHPRSVKRGGEFGLVAPRRHNSG